MRYARVMGRTRIHPSDLSGTTAHFPFAKGNTNYQTQTPGNYLLVNLIRWTLLTSEYAPPQTAIYSNETVSYFVTLD